MAFPHTRPWESIPEVLSKNGRRIDHLLCAVVWLDRQRRLVEVDTNSGATSCVYFVVTGQRLGGGVNNNEGNTQNDGRHAPPAARVVHIAMQTVPLHLGN